MDTMLKESVAVLFCHVIKLDNKNLDVERPLFYRYMKELDLILLIFQSSQ